MNFSASFTVSFTASHLGNSSGLRVSRRNMPAARLAAESMYCPVYIMAEALGPQGFAESCGWGTCTAHARSDVTLHIDRN